MIGADLLRGPRGRRLCWELIGLAGWAADALPPSRIAWHVARAVDELHLEGGIVQRRLLAALAASVRAATYWQAPDDTDRHLAVPELTELLRPLATALATHPHAAWWATSVELDNQHVVHLLDRREAATTPTLTGASRALSEWRADIDADNKHMRSLGTTDCRRYLPGHGWLPVTGRWSSGTDWYSTTRSRPGFGPVELWAEEDAPSSFGWATAWPVRPSRAVRVYEITGEQAWTELVARYPIDVSDARGPDWQHTTERRGTWLLPDWHRIAADYDAVHLSVFGYLTAAGRHLPTGPDSASLIAGWSPDATYWLTDSLQLAGPATHWSADRNHDGWHETGETM